MTRIALACLVALTACPGDKAPADADAPQPRGIANPKKTIDDAKAGVEAAHEAGQQRNDAAFDRAMQGEAPASRSVR